MVGVDTGGPGAGGISDGGRVIPAFVKTGDGGLDPWTVFDGNDQTGCRDGGLDCVRIELTDAVVLRGISVRGAAIRTLAATAEASDGAVAQADSLSGSSVGPARRVDSSARWMLTPSPALRRPDLPPRPRSDDLADGAAHPVEMTSSR